MPGQLIRETNPAQGFAPSLVPQHEDVNGDYKRTGEINPLPVSVEDSGAAAQIDVQYRKQDTKQTHNAVSIAASGTSIGPSIYIDTNGFHELALTIMSDATANNAVTLYWSNDGVNIHGSETLLAAGATGPNYTRSALTTTKARWVKVGVTNSDTTAAHIMSAWAYLKV